MDIIRIAVVFLLLTLTACHGRGQVRSADKPGAPTEWWFHFFTPKALPAVVTFAGVEDTEGSIYQFNTLDSTRALFGVVGEWNNTARAPRSHWNHIKAPPKQIIFCWDSVIDKKVYETHLTFPDGLAEKMRHPSAYKDYQGNTAYYDTIQIGLAPEGKVAVWLQGVDVEPNHRVVPSRQETFSGEQLRVCRGITRSDFSYGYDKDIKDFIKGKIYPYGSWSVQ